MNWLVHKFGGTSVADAERYRAAAEIVLARAPGERAAVVVSAMSGVTNALIASVELAAAHDISYSKKLEDLKTLHLETIDRLTLTAEQASALGEIILSDFHAIEEVLRGVWITRLASERIMEFVSGHGELWSAQLLHNYLEAQGHSSTWLDARNVLVVGPNGNTIAIDWPLSQQKLNAWVADVKTDFLVITG